LKFSKKSFQKSPIAPLYQRGGQQILTPFEKGGKGDLAEKGTGQLSIFFEQPLNDIEPPLNNYCFEQLLNNFELFIYLDFYLLI